MYFHFSLLILLGLVTSSTIASSLDRSSFPDSFVFGVGSSAYQIEGAIEEDGKGLSIWDAWSHKYPEKISYGSVGITNVDVAADFYHRYKEDIKMMKNMNVDAFRFSISWTRILPSITPYVTIFHWDTPLALEEEYRGFLSPRIVNDFRDYADICFKHFGDRVKHWTTVNEPWVYSNVGYAMSIFPPGRCSIPDSLLVTHHQILAHATAANLYRTKYKATQKGQIGVTVLADWVKSYSSPNSTTHYNHKVVERQIKIGLDFEIGSFFDPLVKGDYPKSMRRLLGDQLPKFTEEESKMLRNASFDFIGLNYYASFLINADVPKPSDLWASCGPDYSPYVTFTDGNGVPKYSQRSVPDSSHIYPKEIRDLLRYVDRKYNHPVIYIMENGKEQSYNDNTTIKEATHDNYRINYIKKHLNWVQKSIAEGINVKGYFVWSLMDGFEWNGGYATGCGLYYVDLRNNLKRIPKLSAHWFKKFLEK